MTLHPILALGEETKHGSIAGSVGRLEIVPISKLFVDSTYQRTVSAGSVKNIKRIVGDFDWSKFLPVIVTKDGDTYSIVDGQHRTTAALTLGIEMVPCYVLSCSAAEAAGAFAAINGNVTPMTPSDIWFAELAAQEPGAVALQRVFDASGVTVTRKKEGHAKGETRSISVLRRAMDFYGPAILTTVLQCIVETGNGNPGMLVGSVINGVGRAIRTKPDLLSNPSKLFDVFDEIVLSDIVYEAGVEAARGTQAPQFIITRMINAAIREHDSERLRDAA